MSESEPKAEIVLPADAVYLIFFDDRDCPPQIIVGGAAARHRFKEVSISWNAHLFGKIESNCRDDKYHANNIQLAASPQATAPVAQEWLKEAERLIDTAMNGWGATGDTRKKDRAALLDHLAARPQEQPKPNTEAAHLMAPVGSDLQTALVERLRACAEEVMQFPHPSHCDHLHDASKLMREAADILQYGDCSYWRPACYAEVSKPQHLVDLAAAASEAVSGSAIPNEGSQAALSEDTRRDLAELNFYRRWGYPYTDHSTMCAKDHQGLCAITLPLSLPSPQSEGTCAAIVIRAFTIPQLYQKAVEHVAAIEAEYVQRYGSLPLGESAEAWPSNEKAPESGGATAMEVLTELVLLCDGHYFTLPTFNPAHAAAWDRAKALVSAAQEGATR